MPGRLKPQNLLRRRDFLQVAAEGCKIVAPSVVVQIRVRTDSNMARFGYTVTRKVGNAVIRNRTRRRMRAAVHFLLKRHDLKAADIVLIGREQTQKCDFSYLVKDIVRSLTKGGVLC